MPDVEQPTRAREPGRHRREDDALGAPAPGSSFWDGLPRAHRIVIGVPLVGLIGIAWGAEVVATGVPMWHRLLGVLLVATSLIVLGS